MYVIKGMLDNQFYYFVSSITDQESKTTIRQLSTIINDAMVYDTIEDAENIIKNVIKNNIFKVYPVCPNCHKDYTERSGLSRKDNKTLICSNCSSLEALNDFLKIEES